MIARCSINPGKGFAMSAILDRSVERATRVVWESAEPDYPSHTAMLENGVVVEAFQSEDGFWCFMGFNTCGELVESGAATSCGDAKRLAELWVQELYG